MPQLMPFFWVNSVLMSFLFMMVFVFMYNMISKKCCFSFVYMGKYNFLVKW